MESHRVRNNEQFALGNSIQFVNKNWVHSEKKKVENHISSFNTFRMSCAFFNWEYWITRYIKTSEKTHKQTYDMLCLWPINVDKISWIRKISKNQCIHLIVSHFYFDSLIHINRSIFGWIWLCQKRILRIYEIIIIIHR